MYNWQNIPVYLHIKKMCCSKICSIKLSQNLLQPNYILASECTALLESMGKKLFFSKVICQLIHEKKMRAHIQKFYVHNTWGMFKKTTVVMNPILWLNG